MRPLGRAGRPPRSTPRRRSPCRLALTAVFAATGIAAAVVVVVAIVPLVVPSAARRLAPSNIRRRLAPPDADALRGRFGACFLTPSSECECEARANDRSPRGPIPLAASSDGRGGRSGDERRRCTMNCDPFRGEWNYHGSVGEEARGSDLGGVPPPSSSSALGAPPPSSSRRGARPFRALVATAQISLSIAASLIAGGGGELKPLCALSAVHAADVPVPVRSELVARSSDDSLGLDLHPAPPPPSPRVDPFAVRDGLNDPTRRKGAEEIVRDMGDKYSRVVDARSVAASSAAAGAAVDPYDIIGVGVPFTQEWRGGPIVVAAPPRAGSAAAEAGIRVGDVLAAVDGISTSDRTPFDVAGQLFRDMEAETVRMSFLPPGDAVSPSDLREVVLKRDFSGVPKPLGYKVSEERDDGTKVGYIQLRHFYSTETAALRNALTDLNGRGVNAYVIDLRGNGGGVFQSALGSASLFLDEKVGAFTVDEETLDLTPYLTSKGNVLIDSNIPVVLWIDKKSASATEIFASALRDNCRALIMGERSFGKGLIQALVGLEDGSRLIITVSRFVTPEGRDMEGVGITPDVLGAGIVPPNFIFGKRTDTSNIDFATVSSKLAKLCSSNNDR